MDIEQLYRDYSIPFVTAGQHKHARSGWVNCECPFCTGNPGYHLGYHLASNKFVCYRCGGKPIKYALSKLVNVGYSQLNDILKNYDSGMSITHEYKHKLKKRRFKLPPNNPLAANHTRYLIQRGFDPEELIRVWDVRGTGPIAKLKISKDKALDYKFRILIPFYWEGEMVSFDSRDITGRALNKYMACPDIRETIGHKKILYGKQSAWGDTGICVEGPTDVWRFGVNSFATSGIKYTPAQVRVMAKTFKRVPVVFDGERQAREQAEKLVNDLKFRGVDSFVVDITGDPGDMSQSEANYLVKQLI